MQMSLFGKEWWAEYRTMTKDETCIFVINMRGVCCLLNVADASSGIQAGRKRTLES